MYAACIRNKVCKIGMLYMFKYKKINKHELQNALAASLLSIILIRNVIFYCNRIVILVIRGAFLCHCSVLYILFYNQVIHRIYGWFKDFLYNSV